MNIPKSLNIHTCNKCRGKLKDSYFKHCGVDFDPLQYFFNYECECGHRGRYLLPVPDNTNAGEALHKLGDLIGSTENKPGLKGNIESELNKIVGVDDLFKLGGDDAPRERKTDSDLP